MTTFDGAGVRSGPLPPPPLPPGRRCCPERELAVHQAEASRPRRRRARRTRDRRARRSRRPGRSRTGRAASRLAGGAARRGHAGAPATRGGATSAAGGAATGDPAAGGSRGFRVQPGRRDVADLELERLEAAERPARQRGRRRRRVALVDGRRRGPAGRTRSRRGRRGPRRSVSWVWPPAGGSRRASRSGRGRRRAAPGCRCRTARAGRGRGGGRSRRRAPAAPGRSRGRAAGRSARAVAASAPNRSTNSGQRSVGDLEAGRAGVAAVAEEQRRARLERGAEVERPSLRHDARMTGPSSAPTTAGRPRSSTSRDATSPTIPTGHGPRTIVARRRSGGSGARSRGRSSGPVASPRSPSRERSRLGDRLASSGRAGVVLAVSSSAASAVASSGVVAEQQARPRRAASPIRPAALIRGATANESVSTSTSPAATPAAARSAAIPGRGSRRDPLQPEPDDRPRLAEDRDEVGDAPDRREVGEVQRGVRAAGLVGEEQLGELERDAAAGEAGAPGSGCRRAAG